MTLNRWRAIPETHEEYEWLRDHPNSLVGRWDPRARRGYVDFGNNMQAAHAVNEWRVVRHA